MSEQFEFGPLQTQWLEALESGKYEQGFRRLKHDGRYCCLGVLAELAGLPLDEPQYKSMVHLTDNLTEQYGLHTNYGEVLDDSAVPSLVGMNDDGNSFAEIAAFIRANPKSVFKKAA